jgi:hypothetical protein
MQINNWIMQFVMVGNTRKKLRYEIKRGKNFYVLLVDLKIESMYS